MATTPTHSTTPKADVLLPPGVGTVAFLRIPSATRNDIAQPYKICYKQAFRNWYEVPDISTGAKTFTPVSGISCSGYRTLTAYSGQYTYVDVSCSDVFNTTQAVVKLVTAAKGGCEQEAAGTKTQGMLYSATTAASSVGGAIVNSSNLVPQENGTAFRAYMTMPIPDSVADTTYTICFMASQSSLLNWLPIGSVQVVHSRVQYKVPSQLYHQQAFTITLTSTSGHSQHHNLR